MSEEEKADSTVTTKTQDQDDADAVVDDTKTKSTATDNPTDPLDNDVKNTPVPNITPREEDPDEETYIYRDFSTLPIPPEYGGGGSLSQTQSQKLPAKLASILSDIGKCRDYRGAEFLLASLILGTYFLVSLTYFSCTLPQTFH